MIKKSSNTSTQDIVCNNILEAFIAKRDKHPTTRLEAIKLLNKYDEKKPMNSVASKGTVFAQKSKKKTIHKKERNRKEEDKDNDTPKEKF